MTTKKTTAELAAENVILREQAGLSGTGLSNKTTYAYLDRGELGRILGALTLVEVNIRKEEIAQGLLGGMKRTVEKGYLSAVKAQDLNDIVGWMHVRDPSGGTYLIDIYNPEFRGAGPVYSFRVNIPSVTDGSTLSPSGGMMMKQQHEIYEALVSQFISAGIPAMKAHEQTKLMIDSNPAAAAALVMGTPKPKAEEEDDMDKLFKFMMQQQMLRMMEPTNHAPPPSDPRVAILEAELKYLREKLSEPRGPDSSLALQFEMMKLQMARPEPARTDWSGMVAAIAPVVAALAGKNAEAQTAALSAVKEMATVATATPDKSGELTAISGMMQNMLVHQFNMMQARGEEPQKTAQALATMAATTGGMLQAMFEMQRSLNQGDTPYWLEPLLNAAQGLPEMIMTMLSPEQLRSVPSSQAAPHFNQGPLASLSQLREQVKSPPSMMPPVTSPAQLPTPGPGIAPDPEDAAVEEWNKLAKGDDADWRGIIAALFDLRQNPQQLGEALGEFLFTRDEYEVPAIAAVLGRPGDFIRSLMRVFDLDEGRAGKIAYACLEVLKIKTSEVIAEDEQQQDA